MASKAKLLADERARERMKTSLETLYPENSGAREMYLEASERVATLMVYVFCHQRDELDDLVRATKIPRSEFIRRGIDLAILEGRQLYREQLENTR
jgi:hypothetical protein